MKTPPPVIWLRWRSEAVALDLKDYDRETGSLTVMGA